MSTFSTDDDDDGRRGGGTKMRWVKWNREKRRPVGGS